MANGAGIIQRSRLLPVRSAIPLVNPQTGSGVGIVYGMGVGATRLAGITVAFYDTSGTYSMANQTFTARIAVINGSYPNSVLALTPSVSPDPLAGFEILYDTVINGGTTSPIWLPTWFSGMVSDEGEPLTLICSQLGFGSSGPPVGIVPQTVLMMHADRYQSLDLALSQGSIINDGLA